MKNFILFNFSLLLIFGLNSCKEKTIKEPIKVDRAFSSYVSAFTSGMISSESTIQIQFADDYISDSLVGKTVEDGWFKFSPSIDGIATWLNKNTIEFVPEKPMKRDIGYEATFKLSEITEVPDNLKDFKFSFFIKKQFLEVDVVSVKPYNNNKLQWQYLKGTVITSDVASPEEVEKTIHAVQDNKNLKVTWSHEWNRKLHHFTVDSIERKDSDQEVILNFNGESIESDQKGNLDPIEIPSLGTFKILESKVVQQPDQYVVIRFSDPLLQKQNLDGLLKINGVSDLKYTIEDNEIKIYPQYRLSGSRKLEVSKGLKNILNYKLKEDFLVDLTFEYIKPDIRITETKTILPSSNGMTFPFEAVNISAVDVKVIKVLENNVHQFLQVNNLNGNYQMKRVGRTVRKKTVQLNPDGNMDLGRWNTFQLDLDDIISAEKGAIYRIELSFRKCHSLYECKDGQEADDALTAINEDWDSYSEQEDSNWDYYNDYYYDDYYDDYYYDDYYYDYDYRERDNPCHNSYYSRRGAKTKNVFASDIGIIVKEGKDQSISAAVTNLITTDLMADVNVTLYSYQQEIIARKNTNSQGLVTFENIKQKPFLLVANKGDEFAYIKLGNGNSLSLSNFDVGGSSVQKGIKGFMYGERGVWRPGDTLFLNFILEDEFQTLPKNHPVTLTITNPKGQVVTRKVKTIHENGFYDFITPTDPEYITGNYNANIRVGGATFYKRLKIETIKPNRLKIGIDFGKDRISVGDENVKGKMQVNWLHGAPANKLKARVSVTFQSTNTSFGENFAGYQFDDPVRSFTTDERVVYDQRIDADGVGEIDMNIELSDRAPGFLRAYFNTKVFEEGGEFSVDRFSIPFAPYESFVGMKLPVTGGYWRMIETHTDQELKIASVDADGNPIQRDDLEIKMFRINKRWWWSRYSGNLSQYEFSNGITPEIEDVISTNSKGEATYKFNIKDSMYGQYLIRIVDPVSGHASGEIVYVDQKNWYNRTDRDNGEGNTMLIMETDKTAYSVGDFCQLSFPSSGTGKALISIESGIKVLSKEWVDVSDGQTTKNIQITEDMAPNVFVNVTLIQPHKHTENDRPIRMYGILPITVEDPKTHLNPIISMPEKIRPEEKFKVKVNEQNGQKMTYTVAIVDEGLLDLTNFKTPDPWSYFYAREALGVVTWDMYDDVIGAYGADLAKLLKIGGDGESTEKGKNKANRFKPVVLFDGPHTIEPGKTGTHEFTMPNYVGSVKTMVITGYEGAYGKAEKVTPVKKPLMVLATLPRVVGPSETVKLPVTVFAMEENIKNVKVSIETNEFFTSKDGNVKNITFDKIGDQIVNFELDVAEDLGVGRVKVKVESGREVSTYDVELDVRNPNPEVTNVIAGVLEKGETWTMDYDLTGIDGTNTAILEVSNIPPMNFEKRLKYLVGYPHGCVEQTTSKAFPQLFLEEVVEMSSAYKAEIHQNIEYAINRLTHFQTTDGGFSYWPGYANPNDWGSTYAGHFLLEAEAKGYSIPIGMKEKWVSYQTNASKNWKHLYKYHPHYYQYNDIVQAYRLYTLALANAPDLASMNRLREIETLTVQARWRLAAAYVLAGQKEVAQEIVDGITMYIDDYTALSYTYGSKYRDEAMIIETLVLLGDRKNAAILVKDLANRFASGRWCSTQTTAYGLIAISKFVSGNEDGKMRFSYEVNGTSMGNQFTDKSILLEGLPVDKISGNKIEVVNQNEGVLFTRLILSGKPVTGEDVSSSSGLYLNVEYYDLYDNKIDPSRIEQGRDFKAVVSVRHPGVRNYYEELALTQIFPSGWEILNTRMDEISSVHTTDVPTYQDIRDDRAYSYFNIGRHKEKKYTILLNASYLGRYYLPSITCEAMYDETIYARQKGQWVEVVNRGQ